MSADTLLIAKALDFACRKHVHQRRKGEGKEPYINHLAEVAHLVAEATGGADPALVAAALLHDCIEDQGVTHAELVQEFGADVAMLVMEVTDDKSTRKELRKQAQVDHAAHISARARILKIADKTSNLRAIQHSPPPWPLARKRRYFAWAQAVVAGARGHNRMIDAAFDAEYEKAVIAGLADRAFVWHMALETEGDD
jgi:guanosine-3',5'-bis(diphosphate) 3'-pyrophosphohydrolase